MAVKKKKTNYGDSELMMRSAQSLGMLAKKLNSDQKIDFKSPLFEGVFIAVPVFYALATELALKAWQAREGQGKFHASHDLLELFDGLNDSTKKRLESRLAKRPNQFMEGTYDPISASIRETLEFHRKTFVEWRYLYEARQATGMCFYPNSLDEVLSILVTEYFHS